MKIIKESFNYTQEDIFKYISDVEDLYHDLRDALYALENSLQDYPDSARDIRVLNYHLEDFGESLFMDLDDVKDIFNPSEDEEEEEE